MQYSAFLVAAIVRNVAFPLCIWQAVWYRFCSGRSWPLWTVGYIISLSFNYLLLSHCSLIIQHVEARRLHPAAIPIPRVKGKWPLNVDILMDWMGGRMDYLGEGMVSRLEGAYGQTLNTRVLGEDSVITTSPEHVYQMLDSSFAAFEKGPKWRERVYEMTGDGVFSSDGDLWKYHRATTRPFFKHSRLSLQRILEPHTSTYIAVLNSFIPFPGNHDRQVPQAFDIQRITKCLALDVAMSWLCGHTTGLLDECFGRDQSCDTGNNEKSEGVKVFEAFAEAQAVASMRIKAGTLWSLFEWRKNKMAEPMRIIRGFIRPIVIDAVRKQMTEVNGNATKPKASGGAVHAAAETLLDHLVQVLDDPRAIEDEIINILIAASDTTAAALTACIYCLVMYPECLARIARESEQVPEEKGRPKDVLRECEYLNAFVHEVLRLYPPVPLNIRRSNTAVLLQPLTPGSPPFVFPANTSAILSTLSIQRDSRVWGPDAQNFDPTRWMTSDHRSQKGYPFGIPGFGKAAYPAFHLGPRAWERRSPFSS